MEKLMWRKSSRSGTNGSCVEVAAVPGVRFVRDSKVPDGPALRFTPAEFRDLVHGIKDGKFELGQ